MAKTVKLTVPDLGDFADVEVIEVLVKPGDTVAVEDGLVTLETDKAAMDVPATEAGRVVTIDVSVGDKVSAGHVVATLEVTSAAGDSAQAQRECATASETAEPTAATRTMPLSTTTEADGDTQPADANHSAQLVVIGAGPGATRPRFAPPISVSTLFSSSVGRTRRRVPQRRLHSVQGVAARGQGHR